VHVPQNASISWRHGAIIGPSGRAALPATSDATLRPPSVLTWGGVV